MVPSNVALTDEIRLLQEKVFNVQLTLEHGELVFKASLRVRVPVILSLDFFLLKIFV